MQNLLDYVHPTQGGDNHILFSNGNTLPIATTPFGMNSWVPQTVNNAGFQGSWFFNSESHRFFGMRCSHQPSVWLADYGCFSIMPQVGKVVLDKGGHDSAIRPEESIIKPDYCFHKLRRYDTTLELTPTERCSVIRLRFPDTADACRVFIDGIKEELQIDIDRAARLLTGIIKIKRGILPESFNFHFAIKLDCAISDSGLFNDDETWDDKTSHCAHKLSARLELDVEPGAEVILKIGTSYISTDQALKNLDREIGEKDFDTVRKETADTWNSLLNRIEIEGDTEEQRRTFYSCLYRGLLFPRRTYEIDDEGEPFHASPYDGKIHPGVMYTDNGFWDTHRTVYPFLALFCPEQLGEILQGLVNSSIEGGWTPKWASPGYLNCMIGTHLDAVFADGYVKGITGWDTAAAYKAMHRNDFETGDDQGFYGRHGIEDYDKLGFVAEDHVVHGASRTMDFAYNDFCVAQLAKEHGTEEDYQTLLKRAGNYRNVFDASIGFMRGRNSDGNWVGETFNEFAWGGPFVEGSVWQCGWAVGHDPEGLAELFGGREAMADKLDLLLETPPHFDAGNYGIEIHEMTEMAAVDFGQYAHSNQPSHHILFLFAAAGKPWKTEHAVRRVMDELYDSGPKGFCGDEDNGEMACWYLLNAMGFYPLCPGHPSYVLGSPLFKKLTLHMENGEDLVITADNNSHENVYVQGVQLNGNSISTIFVNHADLAAGANLDFTMSDQANSSREISEDDLPYSLSKDLSNS